MASNIYKGGLIYFFIFFLLLVSVSSAEYLTSESYFQITDYVLPNVTLITPVNMQTYSDDLVNVSFNYTEDNPSVYYYVIYYLNNSVYQLATTVTSTNFTFNLGASGGFNFTMCVRDDWSNEGCDSALISTIKEGVPVYSGGSVGVGFETTYLNCPGGYIPFEGECIKVEVVEPSYLDKLIEGFKSIGNSIYPQSANIGWFVFTVMISFLILIPIYINKRIKSEFEEDSKITIPVTIWFILSTIIFVLLYLSTITFVQESYLGKIMKGFEVIGNSVFPSHPVIGWFVYMFIISMLIIGGIYIRRHFKNKIENE